MNLLKENEGNRKNSTIQIVVGSVLGILTILLLLSFMAGAHPKALIWFLDLPSLLGITLICTAIVLISGVRGKKDVLRVVQKTVIPAGVFVALIATVVLVASFDDLTAIGPNLAMAVLSMLYAVLSYLILIPVNKRLER